MLQRRDEDCVRARFGRTSLGVILLALGLGGCASTEDSSQPPPPNDGGPASEPAAEPGPRNYQVNVTGADASMEGDTLKIEYPEPTDFYDRVPEWVINPTIGGVTGSVGVAATNDLGRKEQIDEARLSGRIEIASMLEIRVQSVGRSELEQDTRVEAGGNANRSRKNALGIDRDILDSVLAGSRQRALWLDEDTGDVYVWMVMDGAVLDRADHALVRDVSVFTANQAITTEFRPDRRRFEKATVIVVPDAPQAAPAPVIQEAAPEPPKTPVEELEGQLKPIETIPTGADDN
jgi:hypothetical protein